MKRVFKWAAIAIVLALAAAGAAFTTLMEEEVMIPFVAIAPSQILHTQVGAIPAALAAACVVVAIYSRFSSQ